MKRFTFQILLALSCSVLVACGQGTIQNPDTPQPSASPTAGTGNSGSGNASALFPQALSKRSLSTGAFANAQGSAQGENAAAGAVDGDNAVSAPMAAPAGMPAADIAEGGARMIMPGYFGNPFEQVELKFVEELTFAAPQGNTLLTTYRQDLLPLVNTWDPEARLLMSSASEGEQRFYLPNSAQEPEQAEVKFAFQWVSNAKKETLMLYVLADEIRMHRMVWGAPNLDLSALALDTSEAQAKAREAFANRSADPGYPVYPEAQNQNERIQVLYDIPADAQWDISLSEQQGSLRYFISVNFKVPNPPASRSDVYAGGYIEMDATTGAIEQLNRPTWYDWQKDDVSDNEVMTNTAVAVAVEAEEVR